MLHLSKSKKGKYHIATVAPNHLELASSQASGLASRKGAFKNIRSQLKQFGGQSVLVQDNAVEKPVIVLVSENQVVKTKMKPGRPWSGPKKKIKRVPVKRKSRKKKK